MQQLSLRQGTDTCLPTQAPRQHRKEVEQRRRRQPSSSLIGSLQGSALLPRALHVCGSVRQAEQPVAVQWQHADPNLRAVHQLLLANSILSSSHMSHG